MSASSATTLFSLSADCICNTDIIYNATLGQYSIEYVNTGTSESVSVIIDSSYSIISTIYLTLNYSPPTYPDVDKIYGLSTYNDSIYGINYDLYIYTFDFNTQTISEPTQPINLTSEKCIGGSFTSNYVSWINPEPIFEYP
jgi:hypothetical protein